MKTGQTNFFLPWLHPAANKNPSTEFHFTLALVKSLATIPAAARTDRRPAVK